MEAKSGNSEETFLERAVQVYKECAKAASITKATASFLNQDLKSNKVELNIFSQWSQRDLERNENLNFQRNHVASYETSSKSFCNIREPSFPTEVQNIQLSCVSPSGQLQAIVRKVPGNKGKEDIKQFLEIWSRSHLLKSIDILACEKHGKIYEDIQFGCLAWSASEKSLLYVAEKKLPKAVSYFERQKTDVPSDKPSPEKGNKFEFKDDWGEQLVSKCTPVLVVFDLTSEEIKVMDGVPDHLSVGQACWGPDDASVVFVGWFHEPYRLGVIYCPIRKSALFSLSLGGPHLEQLSDIKYAVHSPRFNHSKDKLIYIALDVGGAHCKCGRLMEYDWTTKATSIITDVVEIPERGGFPGIYSFRLTDRCWSADGNGVILDTTWRSYKKIILINCKDKSVTDLTAVPGSWTVLDVHKDIILASYNSPNSPPKLMIAALPAVLPETGLSWMQVAQSDGPKFEKEITWEVMKIQPSNDAGPFQDPVTSCEINYAGTQVTQWEFQNKGKSGWTDLKDEYEAVLVKPVLKEDTKAPLIVFPHGGPHVTFTSEFSLYNTCLCKLGFSILNVNFRGSLGFGQTSLHTLPGNIGSQDVQDVMRAATKALESEKLDSSNVFIMGGSHGGLLAAHLIGQYPDFFRAAAMRNGVVNIAVMTGITDIPDWCSFEFGGEFQYDTVPTPEKLSEMLEKSPITHVKKVKTPTLIMLGEEDIRVPPTQGKSFYKALKAQGTKTRLLSYPDNNHPIAKVEAESDAFINIARWFHEHLKK